MADVSLASKYSSAKQSALTANPAFPGLNNPDGTPVPGMFNYDLLRAWGPQNAQSLTTYTLVLADGYGWISSSHASGCTITVPPNASVAFPVGTVIPVMVVAGGGAVTFAEGAGVTINSLNSVKTTNDGGSLVWLKKTDTNVWYLSGDLSDFVTLNDAQTLQNKTITSADNSLSLSAADLTSGSIPDARVPSSAVTQHEASIDHDALTNFVAAEHIDWATAGHGVASVYIAEAAAAAADTAGYGQFWVKNDVPNRPYFTDDAGNDRALIWEGGAFHDGFSDFVANEHIDHTGVTMTVAGTTNEIDSSAGAQDISASRSWTIGISDNPTIPGTGGMILPSGTTLQRSATTGRIRFNTDTSQFEGYDGSSWNQLDAAGTGDVTKVATPANNELGVWTGDGTLEGDADLTWDESDFIIREPVNDGNPQIRLGATDAEELHIQTVYDAAGQTLDYVLFQTDVASVTPDKGLFRFNVDGSNILDIDDGGIELTGSIIVSGTVDGRDVASDGSKLDGIEASADVTDATNVTAAGALMDSELADIAAVKALFDASIADVDAGTSTAAFVTPDGLQGSIRNLRFVDFVLVAPDTDCAVDADLYEWEAPFAGTIVQDDTNPGYFSAWNDVAGATGTMVVDIHLNGTTIMTTNKLDIEDGETSTVTATTQPDLTTTAFSAGDKFVFAIDAIHNTAAKGLTVRMALRPN